MRPTRGFNSERANPFRDHFRAWKQSQKSQETKEIIILVNQYRTKMDGCIASHAFALEVE